MKVRVVLSLDVNPEDWRRDMFDTDEQAAEHAGGGKIRGDVVAWVEGHVAGSLSHLCPSVRVTRL